MTGITFYFSPSSLSLFIYNCTIMVNEKGGGASYRVELGAGLDEKMLSQQIFILKDGGRGWKLEMCAPGDERLGVWHMVGVLTREEVRSYNCDVLKWGGGTSSRLARRHSN